MWAYKMRNVFVWGNVTFYPVNTFFINISCFCYWLNVFCRWMKCHHGSDLALRP